MHKKPPKKLAMDSTVPPKRPSLGVSRRDDFPQIGRTLSTYQSPVFTDQQQRYKMPKYKTAKRRLSRKKIILLVLLPFVLVGLWLGIKFTYNAAKIFHGNILGVLNTTKLQGEDQGRVNILVAGNSADDVGHNGGNLTDSIMIISVNTRDHSALLLSIPRDLYVDIPGYGHAKINEAYVAGQTKDFQESGYASGGMGLLQKTIYQTLGIKTQYYTLINYTAFRDAVNAVGGVDVTISSSDKRGLYDPSKDYATGGPLVKLTNGIHHLTGEQALDLARARGDAPGSYGFASGDFTRTADQRMMLLALKKKVFSTGVLTNPVKVSSLSDALGSNVSSNFKLSEVRRLYDLTKNTGNSSITSAGLNSVNGTNYLTSYRTPRGESALIPTAGVDDFSEIQSALQRLMSNNPVVRENAKVVVLNATDTHGLASVNQDKLEAKNVNVTAVGDAAANSAVSQIINISGGSKPKTLALLKQLYGSNVTTTNPYLKRFPTADFIIIVGQDKVPATTTTGGQ